MRSPLLAVLAAVALACGSDPDPAPPPDTGGEPPDGGGGGGGAQPPAGGGGGGGAQPPGGGSQPPGGGSQPPGGGSQPPGGGGSEDPGSPSPTWPVTSADGTVRIDRTDPSAECDFVPARAPDAVRAALDVGSICWRATTDGGGHVAAVIRSGHGWEERQVFAPDGRPERRFIAGYRLFPQADGFVAGDGGAKTSPFAPGVEAFFPDGSLRSEQRFYGEGESSIHAWTVVEDPRGGALLAFAWHRTDGTGACDGEAHRFDGSGAPTATRLGLACSFLGAGVSNRGEALLLERRGEDVLVRWLRPDGGDVRPPAAEGRMGDLFSGFAELSPLLDGSLAVKEGARFTRRYPHLAERSEAAPAWLAGMPANWSFRFTRGNRGYAWFPPAGLESADCSQVAEVRAPSGRLCATITLRDPGGSCRTGPVDQGWDGTVVQQSAREPCAWRWWPRLLAKE